MLALELDYKKSPDGTFVLRPFKINCMFDVKNFSESYAHEQKSELDTFAQTLSMNGKALNKKQNGNSKKRAFFV